MTKDEQKFITLVCPANNVFSGSLSSNTDSPLGLSLAFELLNTAGKKRNTCEEEEEFFFGEVPFSTIINMSCWFINFFKQTTSQR